jgi:hypothetical protein
MFGQMAAMLLPSPGETVGQQLLQAQDQGQEQEEIELAPHSGFTRSHHEGPKRDAANFPDSPFASTDDLRGAARL